MVFLGKKLSGLIFHVFNDKKKKLLTGFPPTWGCELPTVDVSDLASEIAEFSSINAFKIFLIHFNASGNNALIFLTYSV